MIREIAFITYFSEIRISGIYERITFVFLNQNHFTQLLVMSPSWNFPTRAKPSYEGSKPSRAELGHFDFRAETELTIPTKCFFPHFPPSFYYQMLLVYHVSNQFCDHLLANKVFLELNYMNYTIQLHNLVKFIMKINQEQVFN